MNKWKKAISAGMSAALVASLFTFIAAGTAFASVSATSAGTFAVGTTSTGTVTLTFVERSAAALATGAGSLTVTVNDTDGGDVTWSGTPSTTGSTGSLGASATVAAAVLTVKWVDSDPTAVETIVVAGLKLHAASTATPGPVSATLGGTFAPFFAPSATTTATASGVIQASDKLAAGADTADIILTSVCPFAVTAANAVNSNASFSDAADARAVTAVTPPVAPSDVYSVGFAAGTLTHADGVTVTQTVSLLDCQATLGFAVLPGAVGFIANALGYASAGNPNVFPGESNSPAANLTFTEPTAGFLSDGTTLTLKVTTAGVLFSNRPIAEVTVGDMILTGEDIFGDAPMTLSADRTSASITVDTASTVASTIVISGIHYDVASTVPGGTFVNVNATAGGKLVNPTDNTNAVVGRGITATATPTTVFIGQNAQKTGLITITELAAGFFQGGTGTNNTIEVCINDFPFFTSPGPYAKVTAGDLVLRNGDAAAAAGAIVAGTPVFFATISDWCYTWKVWTASTVASTITIGNSDMSGGPLIDVPANSVPGPVNVSIYIGNGDVIPSNTPSASVQIATAVFQNQVVVTALSQPTIPKGATDARPGNIQIAETAAGQLKAGEEICVEVAPRTSNTFIQQRQDTFLRNLNTSDTPLVAATGGLLVGPVSLSTSSCLTEQGLTASVIGNSTVSFHFEVEQQSVTGAGKLVISNMHFVTLADAATGPVLMNVFGFGGTPTFVEFEATVSNARIGSAQVDAWIAAGNNVRTASAFGLNTVIVKQGARVTLRFKGADATAGDLVQIWVKTKTTAWKLETNRRITSDGYAYYSPKVLNHGYRYYRVVLNGNVSNTVRAFGK